MNLLWSVVLFLFLQLWGFPIMALIFEIRDRVGQNKLKESQLGQKSEKAAVSHVTIIEEIDESLKPYYRPNIAFQFVNDERKRKFSIGYTNELEFLSIESAYKFLEGILPQGTPFTFLASRHYPKKPLLSRPIQAGDSLSPFLTDRDHDFLKSVLWKDDSHPLIEVKHAPGNYSMHQFRFHDAKHGKFEGLFLLFIVLTTTPFIIWGLFAKTLPNEIGITVINFRKMIAIEVALIIATSTYFILRLPTYSFPTSAFFQFEVNAQSIKTLTP